MDLERRPALPGGVLCLVRGWQPVPYDQRHLEHRVRVLPRERTRGQRVAALAPRPGWTGKLDLDGPAFVRDRPIRQSRGDFERSDTLSGRKQRHPNRHIAVGTIARAGQYLHRFAVGQLSDRRRSFRCDADRGKLLPADRGSASTGCSVGAGAVYIRRALADAVHGKRRIRALG